MATGPDGLGRPELGRPELMLPWLRIPSAGGEFERLMKLPRWPLLLVRRTMVVSALVERLRQVPTVIQHSGPPGHTPHYECIAIPPAQPANIHCKAAVRAKAV